MTTTSKRKETVQVYRVYIKATPEAIWEAFTKPEWTLKYGYRAPVEYDLRPGGAYRGLASEAMKAYGGPDVVVDREVVEADPPRKLVQTWRFLWDPELVAEGFTRVTWRCRTVIDSFVLGMNDSWRVIMKAIWRGQVIAESDRTLEVADYWYFPRETVRMDLLRPVPKTALDLECPHGVQFYDVVEGATHSKRAAWSYEAPLTVMKQVDHWIGFWEDVEIV